MSKSKRLYPHLFSVSASIEKHKVHIATSWVKREQTIAIFTQRRISPKKFRDGYAVPILEYFLFVIKETKPIGDCPVMSKLVHYLLKKDITPKEVFNICMDFRSSLIEYLFKQKTVLQKAFAFTNEIALIMDANLSGVLEIFTDVYKESQIKLQTLEAQKEELRVEKEQIQEDASIDKLTGLRNFIGFEKLLQEKIQENLETKKRIFLVLVDIPNLREINISKGREVGDEIVVNATEQLQGFKDEYLFLGRLAGGRFGVLLESLKEQDAYDWCLELYKNTPDQDEKTIYCVTEVDYKEALNKLFMRAYDLIDEISDSTIISTDFKNVIPFKELSDQSEFTNELKRLKTLESSVYYKELPISIEAKIKDVSSQNIQISASQKQVFAAEVGKFMYFSTSELDNVKANICSIDEDRLRLTLDSFRFDIHSPLDRKLYRVKAADEFRAYIRDYNRDYDVKVLDMNNKYIAISIDRKRNFDLQSNFDLHVRMVFDSKVHNFETSATIERVEKIVGGYKLVLFCHLDVDNEEILQEYLASFQRNIIKDFQQ